MRTSDFLRKNDACRDGAKWALSISEEMDAVWDAMVEQGKYDWLIWTATRPKVFSDYKLRKLACRFVRKTPLHDGRNVWDLLTDKRSRNAVEVTELYADGKATYEELQSVYAAASDAVTDVAADTATHDAARAAAYAADDAFVAAAYAAAYAAYAAAHGVAYTTAYAAAFASSDAVYDAAYDAAKVAQIKMVAELGNPFKKGEGR